MRVADAGASAIGMIGLGRMGGNMVKRMRNAGLTVYGYDRSSPNRDATSLEELVQKLPTPRVVWVMVPAGDPTAQTLDALGKLLGEGDVVVDGGNSRYTDDQRHSDQLAERGVGFVDCGVSGGVWGLENGYALMAGGSAENIAKVQPFFDALKPPGESGFVHAGEAGAGHFAKMVHNGIEYGMMQAYGEGFELLQAAGILHDVPGVIKSWTQGTVIRSWLLDLLVNALEEDNDLSKLKGYAQDSGEGRWTVEAAIDHAVPMPVISAALFARFASRQDDSPAMKVVAALRNQFGGHAVTSSAGSDTVGADAPGADAKDASDQSVARGTDPESPQKH
jgi:6-phosphogluconate dehydrogenase